MTHSMSGSVEAEYQPENVVKLSTYLSVPSGLQRGRSRRDNRAYNSNYQVYSWVKAVITNFYLLTLTALVKPSASELRSMASTVDINESNRRGPSAVAITAIHSKAASRTCLLLSINIEAIS